MAEVFSVSGITKHISRIMSMDSSLRSLTVRGELSNVTYHGSGHIYFTMKDSGAQLSGVMFASDARNLKITLQDGMKVDVTGRIGVYEKGGRYQIYAGSIKAEGQGELYEKYLKLKDELEEKGMFSDQYKQAVPEYIKRLGVVTASTGAAVRDIIQITRRRNPYVEIVLYPSKVQGEGAASSIAAGIRVLDKAGVDVIIVGRGGGSIEDLWAFNEIEVAEAIFNCETPVISAVGHQTDTTIADYVADLRAPTPSAAAELAVFEYEEYLNRLDAARTALLRGVSRPISRDRLRIKEAESRLRNMRPDAVIASKKMRLLDMEDALKRLMAEQLSQ
ncbi:MAG: exodeoxyribonuclease VII large subunit, partial [Lachnospiraceae bacterium]|nr:exodeoxyribonuclease VII large subunit [Lachnospiraceae bacterium]